MKIVVFQGGIGNQLFQYLLYRKLQEMELSVKAFNYVNDDHNRLEISDYFDVDIVFCQNKLVRIIWLWLMKFYRHSIRFLIADDEHFNLRLWNLFYYGYWQNKMYFPMHDVINFKQLKLNSQNEYVLKDITTCNSVSLHVRRGDYLTARNQMLFGNICTKDYYSNAIRYIEDVIESPKYFVFSNDIEWCKNNLSLRSAVFVEWNTGKDSIFDMYLMSKCKANILANSTFSYWAAKIGNNDYVVYPAKWFNNAPAPDIFEQGWIGI